MPVNSWFPLFLSKLKVFLTFVVIFLVIFFGLFLLDYFLKVKEIVIADSNKNQSVAGLSNYKSKNIILVSSDQMSSEIKAKNPLIKSVRITKKYPATLFIDFDFYSIKAQLIVGGGFFQLSSDSRILSKNKDRSDNYPTITYYQKLDYYSYNAGDYLDNNDINKGLYFMNVLGNLDLRVDSLDIADKDMLVFNVGDKKVFFTVEKDSQFQSYELGEVLRRLKSKGQDFRSIDLRFDKPVVGF